MSLTERIAKRIIFFALLFVVGSPIFFLIWRPHDDFFYHVIKPSKVNLKAQNLTRSIKNNLYIEVTGVIDLETLFAVTSLLGHEKGFLFGLKDYPKNLILHVREGALYEELKKVNEWLANHEEDSGGSPSPLKELQKMFNKRAQGKPADDDEMIEQLQRLISSPYSFRGRTYSSKHFLADPFENYPHKEDLLFEEYRRDILAPLMGNEKSSQDELYWLLAVDEIPSWNRLPDTNLAVFLFGFGVGSLVLFILLKRKSAAATNPQA